VSIKFSKYSVYCTIKATSAIFYHKTVRTRTPTRIWYRNTAWWRTEIFCGRCAYDRSSNSCISAGCRTTVYPYGACGSCRRWYLPNYRRRTHV